MKRFISRIWVLGIALFLFTACENDPALSVLGKVEFSASPQSSSNDVVITEENKIETLVKISWPAVEFPVSAPVSYTLYFTVPGDASGANGWENAVQRIIGDDVLSASFSGEELNEIALEIGQEPGVEGTVVARVKATMDRDIYSSNLSLKVTPIEIPEVIDYPSLWIAGDFQGWNIGVSPAKISSVKDDGVYEGYIIYTSRWNERIQSVCTARLGTYVIWQCRRRFCDGSKFCRCEFRCAIRRLLPLFCQFEHSEISVN